MADQLIRVGVDPGLVRTGVAAVCGREIILASSVDGEHGLTKAPADERAGRVAKVARQLALAVAEFAVDAGACEVAVETFEYQGGARGNAAHAWMSALLVGAIAAACPVEPVMQRSRIVKGDGGYGDLLRSWKAGRRGLIPGDTIPRNEHERDAALHALWLEANAWRRSAPRLV